MLQLESKYEEEKEFWEGNVSSVDLRKNNFLSFLNMLLINDYQHMVSTVSNKKVLEIGPGAEGVVVNLFKKAYLLDFSLNSLSKIKYSHGDFFYVCASANSIPFQDDYFDMVVCNDVLHHLKSENILKESLGEIHRILKADGTLYVVDRNPTAILQKRILLDAAIFVKKMFMKIRSFESHGSMNEPTFTWKDYQLVFKYFKLNQPCVYRYNIKLFIAAVIYNVVALFNAKYLTCWLISYLEKKKKTFRLSSKSCFEAEIMMALRKKGTLCLTRTK